MHLLAVGVGFFIAHALRVEMSDFASLGTIRGLSHYLPFLTVALLAVIAERTMAPQRRLRAEWDDLAASVRSAAFALGAVLLVVFVGRLDHSRIFFGLWALILASTSLVLRRLYHALNARSDGFERRVAVVGDGQSAMDIAESIRLMEPWGLQFAGAVPVTRDGETPAPSLGTLDDIARIVDENVIDEVVFAVGTSNLAEVEGAFLLCEEAGVDARLVLDFFPHRIARLRFDQFDNFPTLLFTPAKQDEIALVFKRLFDIVVASCLLVFGLPVFLLVALAVRLDSPGGVLFVQERVGRHGRPFPMYKFRSMVDNAETLRAELVQHNERDGPAFKMANDPRITRVGHFIRKTSLDEIPQFVNVLLGHMSIVGPRPPLAREVAKYDRWQRRRLSVRPGITCLWQISGRGDGDFNNWMRLDLAYIDQWSLWLDMRIFLETIPAVLFGRGAS